MRPGPFGTAKIEWPLPADLPLVSIIIPTKDKLELLEPCVDGVLNRTEYGPIEVLIVDNGSVEPRTANFLTRVRQDPRVRVLSYPAPYNFSAMNNFAVGEANGRFLCLLNNDTEVVEPSWLTEMMRYAVRDDVGAVGAKLLYEDGSIQHAGVGRHRRGGGPLPPFPAKRRPGILPYGARGPRRKCCHRSVPRRRKAQGPSHRRAGRREFGGGIQRRRFLPQAAGGRMAERLHPARGTGSARNSESRGNSISRPPMWVQFRNEL